MFKLRWVMLYAIALFIAAVSAVTFFREWGKIDRLGGVLEERMDELVELTRANQDLLDKISYYKTPAGIAHLAREEFNLVKDGEKMYKMVIVSEDRLQN